MSDEEELVLLRAIRRLAQDYFDQFLQDEAEDPDVCISDEQHDMAKALGRALDLYRTGAT